jgi:hemolysin activation/secretion protein
MQVARASLIKLVAGGRVIGRLAAGATTLYAPTALSQAIVPSQVTPQTLRPAAPQPPATISVPPAPKLSAPTGAETLDVLIDAVRIDGAFADLAGPTQRLIAGVVGRRITLGQIYQFATAVEQAYAQAGFPLARVAVPPQQLQDHGALRLAVVDGFIESIDVQGLPERVRAVVAARLADLQSRRHLTLGEIERHILIAGDVPGLSLRSALSPGVADGGTRLIVEGSQKLVTGSFGGDNRLPGSLGNWQYNANLALNSAFGLGEQIYANFGLGADLTRLVAGTAPLRLYGGGVVLPLGHDGITINPEYTNSTTLTGAEPGIAKTEGTFERYALRLSDPLIRRRSLRVNLQIAGEYVRQIAVAPEAATDVSVDHYVVIRIGPGFNATLPWGAGLQGGVEVTRGIAGRGQQQAAVSGIPLSALGAGPEFNKATANIRLLQQLPAGLQLDLSGLMQTAFGHPLLRGEQFSLVDAVSAFSIGTFSVDQGASLRVEISDTIDVSVGDLGLRIAPYVFGAAGHGSLARATALEQAKVDAAALGFGVRSGAPRRGWLPGTSLGLEIARQFSDVRDQRRGFRWNVNFMLSF